MYRYLPFSSCLQTEETGAYISFGIRAVDSSDTERIAIADISTDEKLVTALCQKYTQYQLCPEHLPEVIEDCFGDF